MLTRSIFISVNDLKPLTPEKGKELLGLLDYCLKMNIEKILVGEALTELPVLVNYTPFTSSYQFDETLFESSVKQFGQSTGLIVESTERAWMSLSNILEKNIHQVLMEFYMWCKSTDTTRSGYVYVNFTGALVNGNTYILSTEFMG